jgi:hypothetical protein
MKKLVIGVTLVSLALIGTVAALPVILPVILPMWEQYRPQSTVVVDGATRQQAVEALVTQLKAHYVFPEMVAPIETLLRQRLRNGDYDALSNGDQLAKTLTADMASVAHDLHMGVDFSRSVVPSQQDFTGATGPEPEPELFFMRWIDALGRKMAKFGVEKAEPLPSNIGYLALTRFSRPELSGDKYAEALDKLAGTGAMIIDLRGNSGGSPQAVALLVSYFVDKRTRLNDIYVRDTGVTEQYWTEDTLAGKRYGAQKKVAILVGPNTRSAAEDFAYTMQSLKRATLIGGRTWGGAHPTGGYRLGDHFIGFIPNRRSISPITGTNWEGVGVIPDIEAAPGEALAVAKAHLLRSELDKAGVRPALPVL